MTAPLHGTALQESRLVGDTTGRVRQLRGFQKGFREPSEVTAATRSFVGRLGAAEVQERAEGVFQELRTAFAYKRRELDLALADGAATVRTPDFDVNFWVEQDEAKPAAYRLVTQVASFRTPDVVEDERFLRLFGGYCDRVVIDFMQAFDLAAKIDLIEDLPELARHLDYDAHGSWFTLSLPSPAIKIHVTRNRMVFALAAPGELRTLLGHASAALAALGGVGARAALPGKS
jgi:hypothetical protein